MSRRKKPTALGVYIFAGGFTLGVKRAGFRILAQLEEGSYGVATTRHNHPRLKVYDKLEDWPLARYAKTGVDFVYGNPPCAPFSNAGVSSKPMASRRDDYDEKNRWRTDKRVSCIHNLFEVLRQTHPKVWAWESVQPALKKGRALVDALTEEAIELGYSATYVLMDGVDCGLPQRRRRFFCVFHRIKIPWTYTRLDPSEWPTVEDAFRPLREGVTDESPDIPPLPEAHAVLLPKVGPGGNLRAVWEDHNPPETREINAHGGVKGRPRIMSGHRLHGDRPSPTLLGDIGKIHPTEDRFLTLLEKQLLCGYPPEYEFIGKSVHDRYAQVAQAVLPPVGEWLGKNVRAAIELDEPTRGEILIEDFESGQQGRIR